MEASGFYDDVLLEHEQGNICEVIHGNQLAGLESSRWEVRHASGKTVIRVSDGESVYCFESPYLIGRWLVC